MENKVTIQLDEYLALLQTSERVEVVHRLVNSNCFVTADCILRVLNIEPEQSKGNTDGKL